MVMDNFPTPLKKIFKMLEIKHKKNTQRQNDFDHFHLKVE